MNHRLALIIGCMLVLIGCQRDGRPTDSIPEPRVRVIAIADIPEDVSVPCIEKGQVTYDDAEGRNKLYTYFSCTHTSYAWRTYHLVGTSKDPAPIIVITSCDIDDSIDQQLLQIGTELVKRKRGYIIADANR